MTNDAPSSAAATAYRARWVLPVVDQPIDGGLVTVLEERVVEVGRRTSAGVVRDLGDVLLLPGLVNAHAHLEFSGLQAPPVPPGTSLPGWIRAVVGLRRQHGTLPGEWLTEGLRQCLAGGAVLVGDIVQPGYDARRVDAAPLEVVAFLELLGLRAGRMEPLAALARQHAADAAGRTWQAGLSPHAPYTVHPRLLEEAVRLARQTDLPLAMHLAESAEERQLLADGTGPLVDLLRELEAWEEGAIPTGRGVMPYLQALAEAPRALVIHGNYLRGEEIDFLAARRRQLSVVYCPRTHAYFGHRRYPLRRLLDAGVRVAVGTDSRASNPDLNLFAELCHIAAHQPEIAPREVLALGTTAGAAALGHGDRLGHLAPGAAAYLAVIRPVARNGDPYACLFAGGAEVAAVCGPRGWTGWTG